MHRTVKPLGLDHSLVIWWSEQLSPKLEARHSDAYARQLARGLGVSYNSPNETDTHVG